MQKILGQSYLILLKRFGIALLLFSISRIVFAIFNPSVNSGFLPFIYGLRYDIAAITILNSIFILMHLLAGRLFFFKTYQLCCSILFHVINAIALLFNYIDCAWFPFTQKRTTADFFQLLQTGDDAGNNIPSYLIDYWYILLIWLLTIFLGIFLYRKTNISSKAFTDSSFAKRIAVFIVMTGGFIIAARGGLQYKPLSVQAAAAMTESNSIPLILNTPYTLIKSVRNESIPTIKYFSDSEADEIFNPHQHFNHVDSFRKENVVVIILESFSKEYIGYFNNGKGYTPFLDSLINHSLVFTNSYANGKRSIEGIPAVTISFPALMDEPFITSSWNANQVNSLASLLKPYNYSSAFFHGGNNGTMGFDNFVKLAGFENYFGRNEYDGNARDYDGHWGIYDDSFYAFMVRKLNTFKQPFIATVFSLSSHHPYSVPEKFHGKFQEGSLPIHKSVAYADYSLKIFFENAAKQTWFKNTLFVITADHTGPVGNTSYNSRSGVYEIPIIFYSPGDSLKGINTTVAQQSDILPSVLDLLNYNGNYSSFGQTLFSPAKTRAAINYMNNSWQLITDRYSLLYDGSSTTGLYDLSTDKMLQHNIKDSLTDTVNRYEPFLKAFLQQYRQSLIHNSIIAK